MTERKSGNISAETSGLTRGEELRDDEFATLGMLQKENKQQ